MQTNKKAITREQQVREWWEIITLLSSYIFDPLMTHLVLVDKKYANVKYIHVLLCWTTNIWMDNTKSNPSKYEENVLFIDTNPKFKYIHTPNRS